MALSFSTSLPLSPLCDCGWMWVDKSETCRAGQHGRNSGCISNSLATELLLLETLVFSLKAFS